MLTASNATGQLIFLPLIAKLTQDYGWRSALVFVVVMLLAGGGLVALLLLRDRPSDRRPCRLRRARGRARRRSRIWR